VGIVFLVGTSQVAVSIGRANELGILDFHRVSPLSATAQTIGFLIGAPIREYLVAACLIPFALVVSAMGPPGPFSYGILLIVLLSSTLLFHTLAVILGLVSTKGQNAAGGVVGLIVLSHIGSGFVFVGVALPGMLTVIPTFLQLMEHLPPGQAQLGLPKFFGVELPLSLQSLIYQVPMFLFFLVAASNRMRSDWAHLYSKRTAAAFLTVIASLTMGSMVGHAQLPQRLFVPVMLYVLVPVAMMLLMAVTPNSGEFANGHRRAEKMNLLKPSMWTDLASNRGIVIVFCGIIVSSVQVAIRMQGAPRFDARLWIMTMTAFCVVAYFGFALQLFQLAFGRRARPYLMLCLFLMWLLPIVIGVLASLTFGEQVSRVIRNLSPIIGIASGSWPALVSSLVLLFFFGGLLLVTEKRIVDRLRPAEFGFDDL